jgi:hypothetical protein
MHMHSSSDNDSITNMDSPALDQTLMNLEDGVVGWEDKDDPKHPQNFSPTRKWLITALLSALA